MLGRDGMQYTIAIGRRGAPCKGSPDGFMSLRTVVGGKRTRLEGKKKISNYTCNYN